jgi:hypothetical protein
MSYITKEDVKAIRLALKKEFGNTMKFSVIRANYSSVNIHILQSNIVDFNNNPNYDYLTSNYGDSLYVTKKEITDKVLSRIDEIAKTAPGLDGGSKWYDNSDATTDYFDIAYYVFTNIGKWDKPFKFIHN